MKNKIINNCLNILVILSSFLLLLNVSLKIQSKLNNKTYSSFFGYSLFEVTTGSMAGSIEIGDFILVKGTQNINLNDVVTFKEKENLITHRVIQMYSDKIITKGDSNNVQDKPITREDIVGKVVKVFPKVGIFRNLFLNINILFPFTVIIILLFSIFDRKKMNSNYSLNIANSSGVENDSIINNEDEMKFDDKMFSNTMKFGKIQIEKYNFKDDKENEKIKETHEEKSIYDKEVFDKKVKLIPINKIKIKLKNK